MKNTDIPLSLYVHWPWCVQKCPYCDFNSHTQHPELVNDYAAALIQDWQRQYVSLADGRRISSVFFGGGTPSLAPPEVIAQLIEQVMITAGMSDDAEITLEANPGTVDAHHFAGYHAAGVNRLSLGVQSFDDVLLTKIGRIHSGQQALAAIQLARQVGFSRINIDLMTGLPSQTPAQALADVAQAIDLAPEHLSLYQLTLEPNTPFFSRPPADLPDEDAADDIQLAVHEAVQAAGYAQYEVSAWARSPASRSRHNLNYWQFGDYLAIGAGAHGKITTSDRQVLRYQQHRIPKAYLQTLTTTQGLTHLQQQVIAEADLPFEFLLNALRLKNGVDSALFTRRTGLPLSALAENWSTLAAEGLLLPMGERLVTSEYGYRHLNAVLARWL